MFLPVLILAAIAWGVRDRKPAFLRLHNSEGPFEVHVEDYELLPVTARDWYEGYDVKLRVTLGSTGKAPKWWTAPDLVYSRQETGSLVAPQAKRSLQRRPEMRPPTCRDGVWQTVCRAKLSDLPESLGEIRLKGLLHFPSVKNQQVVAPIPLDIPVRSSGETVAVPSFERVSTLSLLKAEVTAGAPNEHTYPKRDFATIWLWVQGVPQNAGLYGSVEFYTDSGRKVTPYYVRTGIPPINAGLSERVLRYGNADGVELWVAEVSLDDRYIPAGSLKVKCILGSGEDWPLEVALPLRGRNGDIISTPRSAPHFKISGIQVRPPAPSEVTKYKSDVVVQVDLDTNALTPTERTWPLVLEPTWDERVVSDSGEEFLQAVSGNNAGIEVDTDTYNNPGPDKIAPSISYQLYTSGLNIPRDQLRFRGSIALAGSRRVPFSIRLGKKSPGTPKTNNPSSGGGASSPPDVG
jgi:hypothetical protein